MTLVQFLIHRTIGSLRLQNPHTSMALNDLTNSGHLTANLLLTGLNIHLELRFTKRKLNRLEAEISYDGVSKLISRPVCDFIDVVSDNGRFCKL